MAQRYSSEWREKISRTLKAKSPPLSVRFYSYVIDGDDCWNWTGASGYSGYGVFRVDGKNKRAHRVAWEIAHGPIPYGLFVCHHCDNPACIRLDHLFLGTHRDNEADKHRKGRARSGDRHPMKKLSAEARQIRSERLKHQRMEWKERGYPVWNKGLTKEQDPRLAKCGGPTKFRKGNVPWNKKQKELA